MLAFAGVVIVAALAFLPACHLLHRCGCRAPWSGAESACNVHRPSGAHCPWCEHEALGAAVALATVGGQWGVFRVLRRRSLALRAGATLAAYPPLLLVAGLASWLATDYPHFLVDGVRERLGIPSGPIRCVVTHAPPSRRADEAPEAPARRE